MNRGNGANPDEGVHIGDGTDALAAVDDRGRSLFTSLTCILVTLLAVGLLALLRRAATGQGLGEASGGLQVIAAVMGLAVVAVAVWLVVRARRVQRWLPLVIACGGCVGWMAVMAVVARI
jgi:cation transporter-like permease